jgi:hypothetical protein
MNGLFLRMTDSYTKSALRNANRFPFTFVGHGDCSSTRFCNGKDIGFGKPIY